MLYKMEGEGLRTKLLKNSRIGASMIFKSFHTGG